MKRRKFIFLLSVFFILYLSCKQNSSFKYEIIAKDNKGNLLIEKEIALRISILEESFETSPVYSEKHLVKTDLQGRTTVNIGEGSTIDDPDSIDWNTKMNFIKVELDPDGGNNYRIFEVFAFVKP